jgi:hypothetical protein
MKTAVIYFSYTGKTRKFAQQYAREHSADIYEVSFLKRPGIARAFLMCGASRAQKQAKNLAPFDIDYAQYDEVTVMGPIWAGFPAPPVNNIIASLPAGLSVRVIMVSAGSGTAHKDKVVAAIEARGCSLAEYRDMKARDIL